MPRERARHDRGGWLADQSIDRTEHELADWEVLVDALAEALERSGVVTADEHRRGIESMPQAEYERVSYYQRWLYSLELLLREKGLLADGEIERRLPA